MPEWWTYRLADAQVFSAGAYDHLVEHCNRQAWPAQPLVALLGLMVLVALVRRPALGTRALGAAAALACAGVAAWWLPRCYVQLHWASDDLAWGFALQALLLAAWAAGPARWRRAPQRRASAWAALGLLLALALLPWLGSPPGTPALRWEWPGLQSTPTLALTLAVLPLAAPRWRWWLLPLPLAGVAFEAVTQAATGFTPWVLLPLGVLALPALDALVGRYRLCTDNAAASSRSPVRMSDRLAVLPQYLLPKRWLTQAAGRLARAQAGGVTTAGIRWFIGRYGVNMAEAREPDPAAYASFNDFFTRPLRDGARPLADAAFLCPVDGAISQFGPVAGGQVFQAKGHHYSATALLGGDPALAAPYAEGLFATLYLSPRDYHRIHMPCDGRLVQMIHVPGDLFSVNPTTARGVPGLFARNERVVCVFEGAHGPFALVLVGATIVGSMATVWHGVVNPPRPDAVRRWTYADAPVHLQRGQEMGRFLLGSTVVLLFPRGQFTFNPTWAAGGAIRMGEAMSAP